MEAFRTLIKGWLGKVLLVLFLTPLALVGIQGYFTGTKDAVAVEVNGEDITQKQLDTWVQSQKEQYLQAVNGDETLLNTSVIETKVEEAAIVRTLLIQQAQKLGIHLSDEAIGSLLRQQQAFQQDGQFSQQLFDNYLMSNRTTMQQVMADARQQTALSLLTGSILNTALFSPQDTQKLVNLLGQERNTYLAEVSLDQFAQDFIAADKDAKAYYDKHVQDYTQAANVDVNYVVLDKASFANQVQVTDEDIKQQYSTYVADLTKDAKRQISHILITTDNRTPEQAEKIAQEVETKLKGGESFESLVQQYSEDTVSKETQGKVEGYTVGAYGDAFDSAVLALKQGGISQPVKTDFGYSIIRLDALSTDAPPALAQVQDELIQQIKDRKAENAFQDAVNNANDLALETDSLEALAEQYKVPVQSVKSVTQTNNLDVLSDPAVKAKLFSTEIAQGDQNVSVGVTLQNNDVAWFKVSTYRAQRPKTFEEAKANILAILKQQEQVKQAEASVKSVLADFKNKPGQQVIGASKLNFQNIGLVPRYSQVVPLDVEKAIYSVSAPNKDKELWSATSVASGNYLFVVAVSDISQNPAFQLNDSEKSQLVNRFAARGQQELNDYIEYLRSTAKIKEMEK